MFSKNGETKHQQEVLSQGTGFIFNTGDNFPPPLYWQCIDCQKLLKGLDLIISLLAHFISIAMATFSCLSSNAPFNQIFPHSFLCALQQCNEIYSQAWGYLTASLRNLPSFFLAFLNLMHRLNHLHKYLREFGT